MENICDYDLCTGCFTCQNVCPKNSITLLPDKKGELHPVVNMLTCVNCGLCKTTCPVNIEIQTNVAVDCYAAWVGNNDDRQLSSSGGIAALMYKYFIEIKKGVAYGVLWNDVIEPHFDRIEDASELDRFKGSKYVQAFVDDSFRRIKSDLLAGRYVLFIGTPCQVAGLKSFLNKDYDKLLTCDLLCHGVPPYEYFKQELSSIKGVKLSQIENCRFRGNDKYNYYLTLWGRNKELLYSRNASISPYLLGFLVSLTLRESCYSCRFACKERVADISIGDFIGIKNLNSSHSHNNIKNISVCIPVSDKGKQFWKSLCQFYPILKYEKRSYSEAVNGGPSLRGPAQRNYKRDKFLCDFQKRGWRYAITRALWKSILRNIIMTKIKK